MKLDFWKIKELEERLEKETQDDQLKIVYMWVKQDIITLEEFQFLMRN